MSFWKVLFWRKLLIETFAGGVRLIVSWKKWTWLSRYISIISPFRHFPAIRILTEQKCPELFFSMFCANKKLTIEIFLEETIRIEIGKYESEKRDVGKIITFRSLCTIKIWTRLRKLRNFVMSSLPPNSEP